MALFALVVAASCGHPASTPKDGGSDAGADAGIDAGDGAVHGCYSNADCSGTTPYCVVASGQCVECLKSYDCPIDTQTCQNNVCAPEQVCTRNADCMTPGLPFCRTFDDRICVECVHDSDCAGSEGCLSGLCVTFMACTADNQCGSTGACHLFTNGDSTNEVAACATDNSGTTKKGGAPCSDASQCESNYCWDSNGHDGYCVDVCESDNDCSDGAWCPPLGVFLGRFTGPDGVYDTVDDVDPAFHVCVPKQCASDTDCVGTSADGGDRACTFNVGGYTTPLNDTGDVASWIQGCLPTDVQGDGAGGAPCTFGTDCFSGHCQNHECFQPCVHDGDCSDGGTCSLIGSGFVDEFDAGMMTCRY